MKIKSILLMAVCALVMASCTSYKNVPYLQNAEEIMAAQAELPLYDAKIMPKDLLTVTVNTTDPEAAAPFMRRRTGAMCWRAICAAFRRAASIDGA